ncbi:flagellar basal body rod protein FlgB [Bacillus sp. Marseille-P3661]|uniref:flagellar basal body rod protein FlgB n=1 Tax=Bacillus sp. Marseille-P3661 TaxID=1936234 RepID=UPI000C8243E8|nr:flagellar basal body rod protein FlgB [Bacillus sp. Marseille-P3661]
MKLFSNSINLLENSLAYSATKQRVIANNIANVDTPNYKARTVSFKTELENATLKAHRLNEKHIDFTHSSSSFQIRSQVNTSYNHNGNNVDIDKEMAEMAQNQIYYNLIADRLNSKFNGLKEALKGANG